MKPYYEHAGIRIFLGDCREILPSLGTFDLLLTDPPYGIEYANHDPGGTRSDRSFSIVGDGCQTIGNEVLKFAAARNWQTIAFASPKKPWPGEWRNLLVWDKGEGVGGGGDTALCWKQSWELIQVARNREIIGRRDSSVLSFHVHGQDFIHPTQKPVSLISYLIEKLRPSNLIDPFLGSGSSLVAAKALGIPATGIEIEERWCELSARRLQQEVLAL